MLPSRVRCCTNSVVVRESISLHRGNRTTMAATTPVPMLQHFGPRSSGAGERPVVVTSARSSHTSDVFVRMRKRSATRNVIGTWPSLTLPGNSDRLSDPTHDRSASTPTSKMMNKERSRHASKHSWQDDLEATAQEVHEDMDPHGEQIKIPDATKWDRLTIWQWFSSIDEDRSGSISRQEWMCFLRDNPKFRAMLLNVDEAACPDASSSQASPSHLPTTARAGSSQLMTSMEVKEMRKLMSLWNELDTDNSGSLDFDEFVRLFQRTGHYLQYQDEATNPREQLASVLSGTQANKLNSGSGRQSMNLARRHISRERRPTVEFKLMQQIGEEFLPALQKEGQSPFDMACTVEVNRSVRRVGTAPALSSRR